MVKALTYGRAGNFYFQVAASAGFALKHGLEFTVNNHSTHDFWNPIYLQHLVNPKWNPALESVTINEKRFCYDEILFHESLREKNIILNGYWQSPHYFSGYEKEIIELFNYPWHLQSDVCSIQARFGDYITIPGKHILVNEEYLKNAMRLITNSNGITRFKVFSDDINHFKSTLGHIYNFEYSNNKTIEQDLVEISCCHSNINSSSTFSWWSAFLNRNPDKIIITPINWFQEGWKDDHGIVDTKDIIPSDWLKV